MRLSDHLDFLLLSTPDLRDRLLDNIEWSSGSGEMLLEDLGLADRAEITFQEDDVRDITQQWAREAVESAGAKLAELFELQGGSVEVWRVITAPADWKPEGRDFGLYWAWSKDSAGAYEGRFEKGFHCFLLRTRVDLEQVDWEESVLANAHPSFDHECEVRLKPDTEIDLLDVTDQGPARRPTES